MQGIPSLLRRLLPALLIATASAVAPLAAMSAEQIALVLAGGRPPRLVNPEVWPAYEQRRARILR